MSRAGGPGEWLPAFDRFLRAGAARYTGRHRRKYGGNCRRSTDSVSALSREHDSLVTTAVDPWEIAAGLEAAGINDRRARDEFGHRDVFVLAEMLFRRVPLRFGEMRSDSGDTSMRRALVHGLLYAVPVLFALGAGPLAGPDRVVVLASLVAAWGWTQGMAYVAHSRLGTGDTGGAGHSLRVGALAGVGAWLPVTLAAFHTGTSLWALGVATAQVLYFLASAVAVVLGRQLLLLAMLAPGAAAALGYAADAAIVPARALVAAVGLSVLASAALAFRLTSGGGAGIIARELRGAAPYAANGCALAVLLVAALLVQTGVNGVSAGVDVAALPIVWAMAMGEELLRRYRSRIRSFMLVVHRPEDFAPLARRALRGTVAAFVSLTASASLVTHAVQREFRATDADALLAGAYVVLAGAMFVAVVLAAVGEVVSAAAVAVPGAAVVLGGVVTLADQVTSTALTAGYLAACAFLLLVLMQVASTHVQRVWTHR